MLITDQQSKQDGGIYRLERNPSVDRPSDFPEWLSETGLFASTAQHRPQTGVLPYEVNAPAWHDGAIAERLLAIPAEPQPDRSWDIPSIGFHPTSSWRFPEGTVLAQTLTLETDPGNPQSRRRMETRLMTFQHGDWDGYSYVWNEDQTDARLVEKSGTAVQLTMGSADAHSLRTWRVPSRSECEACHSRQAGFVLGMNAPQLNRSKSYNGHVVNQLRYLEQKQLVVDDWSARANDYWSHFVVEELKAANQLDLENNRVRQEQVKLRLKELTFSTGQRQAPPTTLLGKSSEAYASLADPYGDTAALELRARSYLHVNCSSCHVRSGGGNALINLSAHASDADLNVLGEKPLHGDFGLTDAKLVAPGSPCRSVINYRMSTVTGGRMPRVGSHQVDVQGAKLIRDWIRSLDPGLASDDPFQQAVYELVSASPGHATTVAVKLLSSPSGALALIAAMDQGLLPRAVVEEILQRALASPDRNIQRLFERYLPEGERKQTLGTNIVAADVLKLTGDASRGKQLFLENEALACASCHAYENRGHQVGPDLTRLGHAEAGARKEYSRAEILDSLLHPSRKIDEQYAAYTLLKANGKVHSGLLVEQTDEFVTLKQVGGQTIRAQTEEIDELSRHPKSLMPDHLLRDLSAQEAADLLAFLVGLLES